MSSLFKAVAGLFLLSFFAPVWAADNDGAMMPVRLRCELRDEPLGIDVAQPRLGWQFVAAETEARGLRQSAYRILAASSLEKLAKNEGDLWDSGQVQSDQSQLIPYGGKPLTSSQAVVWRVRSWDQAGKASPWSAPAHWSMGLLKPEDWQGAQWIGIEKTAVAAQKRPLQGYHAGETKQDEVKWVQVDLGQSLPLAEVILHPMRHADQDGFGFPLRFRVEGSDDPEFKTATLIADCTAADVANPGIKPVHFEAKGIPARHVRVTAIKLKPRPERGDFLFALSQLEVRSGDRNVAAKAPVTAKDSVEAYGWGKTALTDGCITPPAANPIIYPTLLLRREFTVAPGLRRAVVQVCGLGQYEMTVNGKKVGSDLLAPGWTNYRATCLYDTHDITALLQPGANAAGLCLGNGMYNVAGGRYIKFRGSFGPLKAIALLRLEYADGRTESIVTDGNWRAAAGPITFSCIYGGEDHDARLEPAGWDSPKFNDQAWMPALVGEGPGGTLRGTAFTAPPLRAFETLKPVASRVLRHGVTVYDLGQNASLIPRLTVRGPAGSVVRLIPAELVRTDGSVDRGSCGGGQCWWQYTLAGRDEEIWFPKFFYHGSRYLQVELSAPPRQPLPEIKKLEGVVVHSAAPPAGDFSCSSELFNRTRTLIRWAQLSNLVSVITDCPHRERLGWLEQYHLHGPSLRYEWDLTTFYAKTVNDMAEAQLANGLVPDIAPEYTVFGGGFRDSPEWGSSFIIVPWQQYGWTGDLVPLRQHYAGMKRYVDYLTTKAKDHIVDHGLGDWYDIGPRHPGEAQLTPKALTATAYYCLDAEIVAKTARLLGQAEDAAKYETLARTIQTAFNRRFFDPATGKYATGSQCANAIPLAMGIAEPASRPAALEVVVKDIRSRGNAFTAGDIGFHYLLRALADGGRSDVIFDMNSQSDKPGYGYQLKQGATSLAEAWDAGRGSSQNHFMLGHVIEWFYHDLAGIQPDPAAPGFRHIVIKPDLPGDLTWVKAHYDSLYGRISSHLRREGKILILETTIPLNASATIAFPAATPDTIREGDKPAAQAPGLKFLRMEGGRALFEAGSGTYRLSAVAEESKK